MATPFAIGNRRGIGSRGIGVKGIGVRGIGGGKLSGLLAYMPLIDNLDIPIGTGVATFTRSTTGTFVDRNDGLVKTAAIDTPRFEKNGVLIEGSSTNLLLRSEELDNAAWSLINGAAVTANTDQAPDGTTSADKITGLSATNQTIQQVLGTDPALKTFTMSMYLKGSGIVTLGIANNVDESIEEKVTLTSTFVRHEITATMNATSGNLVPRILSRGGDSATEVVVWGAQIEELPFASSYIPTTTTAVTRTADDLTLPSSGNILDATGTIAFLGDYLGNNTSSGASQDWFAVSDGTNNNRLQLLLNRSTENTRIFMAAGGVGQVDTQGNLQTPSTPLKYAVTYKVNEVTLYESGTQSAQDLIATMPSGYTIIHLGKLLPATELLYGHIKDLRIYDRVLTAPEVAGI